METQYGNFLATEHFVAKNIGDQCKREVKQQTFKPRGIVDGDFGSLNAVNWFYESGQADCD